MSRFITFTIASISAAMLAAGAAQAHPKLVSSNPAADSSVVKPAKLELNFSETLVPAFSGADIVMTAMPGMSSHAPMKMKGLATAVGADGKSLVITPKGSLPAGDYAVNWHAVGGDGHRVDGSYVFTVK